ncbi:unnamed protein product [Hermetia illucens]|uniref:Uncharacterized protein n=1 Tax=Hermetia illucens TaxID=343691 RepID=A0A7R8YSW8_HERIL|nr:larval serum protein 1 alpha chain-like [Hermetia illucens]CAD7081074.1 unnamed protein product [Hermetia illucens]
MKVLVLLFALVAFASAWLGRDVNDWKRDRYLYDVGLGDHEYGKAWGDTVDYGVNKHIQNFDDSREKLFGVGVDTDNKYTHHPLANILRGNTQESIENIYDDTHVKDRLYDIDHTYKTYGRVKTVPNVDKKLVKYDDDLKARILGDKDLLIKQKLILDVLRNVYATWTTDEKDKDFARLVEGEVNYKNFDKVIDFFHLLKNKNVLLPRGQIFTIKNKIHVKQLRLLFNLFVYSKDFKVFRMNVLWARKYVNEEMFAYALIAAVLHRDDLVGVKLPAIYEIFPYKFHTSVTIDKALKLKDDLIFRNKDLIVLNKYTSDYVTLNDEGKLTYLTEDIGWNMYNFFFHMEFASWIGGKDFKLDIERRGEKYLYHIQQILARYYLERISHGLGDVKDILQWGVVKDGYNPLLTSFNGLPFTSRKNYYDISSTGNYELIDRIGDYGRRIRDAIDEGFCTATDGGIVDLKRWDGADILGNLIQGNVDSVNTKLYGGFIKNFFKLLGSGDLKNVDDFKLTTSVLEHHETVLRDPVTYQILKKITKLYYQLKDYLPSYKKDDLLLDGVRVVDVKTTPLVTYFDFFDVDITNIVGVDPLKYKTVDTVGGFDDVHKVTKDTIIRARHVRLNHKPFTITLDLNVDKPQKVVFRIFLGPKFDSDGKLLDLKKNRKNFVEIDKFTRDLTTGQVRIERNSRDLVYTVKDRTTFLDIYKKVLLNADVNSVIGMHVDEANCGFPDRLLLPKGWIGGLPLQLFVIVTKAKDVVKKDIHSSLMCGKNTLINEVDDLALGFPFDRPIDLTEFYTKNMLFKDVLVFHDIGDVTKVKDLDGRVVDSKDFVDIDNIK